MGEQRSPGPAACRCGKTPAGKSYWDSPVGDSWAGHSRAVRERETAYPGDPHARHPRAVWGQGTAFPRIPWDRRCSRGDPRRRSPAGLGRVPGSRGEAALGGSSCSALSDVPGPFSGPSGGSGRLQHSLVDQCCATGTGSRAGGAGGCGTVTGAGSGTQPGPCHFPSGIVGCGMCVAGCPCGDVSVKGMLGWLPWV